MTIAQLYTYWIAYFVLLCVLIIGRPVVFARWPHAYGAALIVSRTLMLSLLVALVYAHHHLVAPELITFGVAFRTVALLMMLTGTFLTLRSLLRQWRGTAPTAGATAAPLWQRLSRRIRPQAAWGGILLFITGYPIYHPALHNFVVAGIIALGIVAQATLIEWLPARVPMARHTSNAAEKNPAPCYVRRNNS